MNARKCLAYLGAVFAGAVFLLPFWPTTPAFAACGVTYEPAPTPAQQQPEPECDAGPAPFLAAGALGAVGVTAAAAVGAIAMAKGAAAGADDVKDILGADKTSGEKRGSGPPAAPKVGGKGFPAPSIPQWPPPGPTGPKPALGKPGADEWRYERYRQKCYQEGRPRDRVLPYDQWRQSHYEPAAAGGRPGRRGGPAQVRAKTELREQEGVQPVENVRLGPQFVDGVRRNRAGGTDYFEVGKMAQDGLPYSRERIKLANEAPALGPNDTLTFVDEDDVQRRIPYQYGDDPLTKRAAG